MSDVFGQRSAAIDPRGAGVRPRVLEGGVGTAALALIGLGVVMSYSTTAALDLDQRVPPLFKRHLAALAIGLCSTFCASRLPVAVWYRLALPLWTLGVALLGATALFGVDSNGAQRWLAIGALHFQPVEIAKFATVIAVAAIVATREGHRELGERRALAALGLTLAPVVLLLLQPDLGNAVLLAGLAALIIVAAGQPLRRLLLPGLLAAAGVALYVVTHEYAWRRVVGFLDPWQQSQDEGFQLVQSFVAFGQGGLLGSGLGNGIQKLDYLFGAHTDFVLALVGEELGLLGVLGVLGAFAALLVAGCRIAWRQHDRFPLLLAFGMTTLLTVPALVNAAVVMGLLPTKGLTLPFLSYGGTSLVMCCTALGVLLGVGRHAETRGRGR